ncbi:hypothetical protein DMN91_003997 [Ooceraea biroi]|uniref:Uncharacterized protein n=1 Tax=Ooceraea biroi TaxID=2015173 RepID=A0A3L8DV59_OOCBI|nr:hypothetical protein DMN91_003997 [Ooceraea biroi]
MYTLGEFVSTHTEADTDIRLTTAETKRAEESKRIATRKPCVLHLRRKNQHRQVGIDRQGNALQDAGRIWQVELFNSPNWSGMCYRGIGRS